MSAPTTTRAEAHAREQAMVRAVLAWSEAYEYENIVATADLFDAMLDAIASYLRALAALGVSDKEPLG